MTKLSKTLFLALSATALLSGCDDNPMTGWLEKLRHKDDGKKIALSRGAADYGTDTQAGNYLAGQFAQYRQDWRTANKYLDKVIALDPENVDLQQRAMILAMQAGEADRAIALAQKVLEEDDKNILALLFVSVGQLQKQDYQHAVRTLSKLPENGIADFIRPILLNWAKAQGGKVDDEGLVANGPLHAYHALLIADFRGKVGDPERYFVNVLSGGGADTHILEMMGDVFSRQGKIDLAKKIYDTLISQYQNGSVGSGRLALLEEKRDNPEAAKAGRIMTPAEGGAEAFYNVSRVLFQDQSDESALVFARLSEYLDPAKDDAKMLMARMMVRSEHMGEAIEFYKAVKPESPEYLEAQRGAAELLEQQGDIDGSIDFLEKAYSKNKDINALVQIGDVYRRAERHQDAIKAYDRAIDTLGGKVNSDYWQILYARGMSYERTGNMKKAEEDLQAALEFKPDHPYLLNYLGYSWADQGKRLDEALQMVEKAANLKPDDGYIIDSLGWVYFKKGQYEEAARELEKAIELVPYDATINDHLGDAYWKVGRRNEARFQWQRALNHTKEEKAKAALEVKISDGLPPETKAAVKEAKSVKSKQPTAH